jgi:integrase
MKLTSKSIAALSLSDGKNEEFHWDDAMPGFGIRLRGKTRRWYVQYRVGAQQRRECLGDMRKVPLDAARDAARVRFGEAAKGIDPKAAEAKARAEAKVEKLTLKKIVERYLKIKADQVRPRTFAQAKLHLENYFGSLEHKPIGLIKRADAAVALQDIIQNHGRVAAARARTNLSSCFVWAMKEGLCETNPTIATNNPAAGIKSRDRVLTDQEIAAVWRACGEDDFGRIVRLLILTGCRREEIGDLKWSDVDTCIMTIAGSRTKNHKALVLTLPPLAMDILKSAPRRAGRDYAFGGGRYGFNAWSYSTMAMNARIAAAEGKPLPHWTLHDLRRSFRTGLGRLGVEPHIAERCVNHIKDSGVEAIYDRFRYQDQITAALALWADHVGSLLPSPIPSKRKHDNRSGERIVEHAAGRRH